MTEKQTPARLNRRGWMGAAAGALLAAGGAMVITARQQRAAQALDAAELAFWAQSFARIDGAAQVDVARWRGRALLVNFWATWCPPCVAELPLLDAFAREHADWTLLGLAVDQPTAVQRFVAKQPLSFDLAMAGYAGIELSRSLGNLSGALPFSVVFAPNGHIVHRKMGKLSQADLASLARSVA